MKHLANVTCYRFVQPSCKKPHPTASRTRLHTHPPTHHGRSRAIPSHTTALPPPPHCLPLPTAAPRPPGPRYRATAARKGCFIPINTNAPRCTNIQKRPARLTKEPRGLLKGQGEGEGGSARPRRRSSCFVPGLSAGPGNQRAPRCGRLSSRSPRSRPAALSTPRSHSVHFRTSPSSSAAAPSSSSSYSSSS